LQETIKTKHHDHRKNSRRDCHSFPLYGQYGTDAGYDNYLRYREFTANNSAPQSEADVLALKINRKWWKQNAAKFEKLHC
jgi:hypothetical protein